MSVLCCRIPNFLLNVAQQRHPEWTERPVALLGPDTRVWAVSETALAGGVRVQMTPRQAQMRCPDVLLPPVDLQAGQEEQAAFLADLSRWELPVEPLSWGMAYLDLAPVARAEADVRALALELGQTVRRTLGATLQPSLGWDSGKFTARVAAGTVVPGRMRLVPKVKEVPFLHPQPITLLPLPPAALQQLQWLGIRTLGQFAALPSTAVWQRFGEAGKLAQCWAQGRDDRPVWHGLPPAPPSIDVDIDPPTGLLAPVIDAVMAALRAPLARTVAGLQGWRRLRLTLHFVDGETRPVEVVLVEPVTAEARLCTAITARLTALNWPAEVSSLRIDVQEVGELPAQQMTLLPELSEKSVTPSRVAAELVSKYGPRFFHALLVDPDHPVAERRAQLQPAI